MLQPTFPKSVKLSGDNAKAKTYYAKLLSICERADRDRPELQIRFIRHAARWRRFFRCSLAASNFRSLSFAKSVRLCQRISFHLT